MPGLQEFRNVPFYHVLKLSKFVCSKAKVLRQRYGLQPELCREVVAVNMDVRRFVQLMAPKVESVRTLT
jgi:hypothetical protein